MNLRDHIERFLIASNRAGQCVKSTERYRVLKRLKYPGTFYFLGPNGAVRVGKTVSKSLSISDSVHLMVETWEQNK
jgi:hypothetical protein